MCGNIRAVSRQAVCVGAVCTSSAACKNERACLSYCALRRVRIHLSPACFTSIDQAVRRWQSKHRWRAGWVRKDLIPAWWLAPAMPPPQSSGSARVPQSARCAGAEIDVFMEKIALRSIADAWRCVRSAIFKASSTYDNADNRRALRHAQRSHGLARRVHGCHGSLCSCAVWTCGGEV